MGLASPSRTLIVAGSAAATVATGAPPACTTPPSPVPSPHPAHPRARKRGEASSPPYSSRCHASVASSLASPRASPRRPFPSPPPPRRTPPCPAPRRTRRPPPCIRSSWWAQAAWGSPLSRCSLCTMRCVEQLFIYYFLQLRKEIITAPTPRSPR